MDKVETNEKYNMNRRKFVKSAAILAGTLTLGVGGLKIVSAADDLLGPLNEAIGRAMGISIQYMWQHVMATGIQSPEVKDIFKDMANVEMTHAEEIAERLFYLGGTPTTKPTPINVGSLLNEMIEIDLKTENEILTLYTDIIRIADNNEDPTTRLLFEKIIKVEEEHKLTLSKLLS